MRNVETLAMIDFGTDQQKLHTGKHPMGLAPWRSEWLGERTSECLPETVNSACSGSMRPSASRTASNRDAVSGS